MGKRRAEERPFRGENLLLGGKVPAKLGSHQELKGRGNARQGGI